MAQHLKKGYLVLTMGRSGSNWLGSIANQTGNFGDLQEWLGFEHLENPPQNYTAEQIYARIMQNASTDNGHFAIKIFPRHLQQVRDQFGFDFIRKCHTENDVKYLLLRREDRLAQAVSFIRANQTGKWLSTSEIDEARAKRRQRYDFNSLCIAYFHLGRGYDFWRSYLSVNQLPFEEYAYESLLGNPAPWFKTIATHLNEPAPKSYQSTLDIQRDALTAEWIERFKQDIITHGLPDITFRPIKPAANLLNAWKVFRGRGVKIDRSAMQN